MRMGTKLENVGGLLWDTADGSSLSGTGSLTNTIIFCVPGQTNAAGTFIDGGHNICSDASASFSSPTSHNDLDPLLGPVADNGSFTPTVALLPNSPALGAADPAACPPTDQRRVRRPIGSGYDIGAFKLAPVVFLTRLPEGKLTLGCVFEPASTNLFLGSPDLINWTWLATRVADEAGKSEVEEDVEQFPVRFYKAQVQTGP